MAPFFTGISRRSGGFGRGKVRFLIKTLNTFTSPGSVSIPGASVSVLIQAHGQSGARWGSSYRSPTSGGVGGYAEGTFTSLAGTTLNINFAGAGPDSAYGSGGGNYAGVFNGPVSQGNSLIIAGGGGGKGSDNWGEPLGGLGGGTTGGTGGRGTWNGDGSGGPTAYGGQGGTQSAGGAGGAYGIPTSTGSDNGYAGSALQGGRGGGNFYGCIPGVTETYWAGAPGGGGAGGYFGGGGGGTGLMAGYVGGGLGSGGGGGGGSSYIHPSASNTVNTQGGTQYDYGYVAITYSEYSS